jgi:hypothetical protein
MLEDFADALRHMATHGGTVSAGAPMPRTPTAPRAPRFILGLDLGQAQDFTAVAAAEVIPSEPPAYHLRHLERLRLGTPYPVVVAHVKTLLTREPLRGCTDLVVDATGVGPPVVDLLRDAGLSPVAVTIHGGDTVSEEKGGDRWRVPKRDLVATLQVLLQTGRLKVAEALPDAATLVRELLAYQVKLSDRGHDSYNAREGAHDDLVLAVALAVWWGERGEEKLNVFF